MKNLKNLVIKNLRYLLLALFLGYITVEAYLHQVLGGKEAASIHALCPYGGLESLYSIIFSGTFVSKIFSGTMVLLVGTIIIGLIFRRSFCGVICPFGALQEFFGILGKKIFKKRFIISSKVDKPLRYLKYVVLIVTLYFAWKTSGLWVNSYDPWAAYGHLSSGFKELSSEYLIALILLVIVIIGSLLYDKFFCKYMCPMGAFYGLLSKVSPSKIVRNEKTCVSCGLCSKGCPMNIKVSELKEIKSSECISCQTCINACPKKDTLQYKVANKTVKPIFVIVSVVVLFLLIIGSAKIFGLYRVTPKPVSSETTIEAEDLKGYMTIEEVSNALNISLDEVYQKLDLPESISKDTRLKDISNTVPDFETEDAKEKLK